MRPVELQPAILQTPNVERSGQQNVANPQTAQAAFAAELQRRAAERPDQVQAAEAQQGAQSAEVKPEEHGEKRARRMPRKRRTAAAGPGVSTSGETPTAPSGAAGGRIDVVI
ncbi:MAG: hypothetical protein AAB152_07470 [Candidatus Coatesbacteria bacterium]